MKFPDDILNLDETIKFFQTQAQQFRNPQNPEVKQSENCFNISSWLTELKKYKLQEWINYEDPTMFNSWVAKFKLNGEIEFRQDLIKLLSEKQKQKIRKGINEVIKKIKNQ